MSDVKFLVTAMVQLPHETQPQKIGCMAESREAAHVALGLLQDRHPDAQFSDIRIRAAHIVTERPVEMTQ